MDDDDAIERGFYVEPGHVSPADKEMVDRVTSYHQEHPEYGIRIDSVDDVTFKDCRCR